MLAALLLNEPYPGGVGKEKEAHDRAERALDIARKEYFERQEREKLLQDMDAATALADRPDNVYRMPAIDKNVPDADKALRSRVDDDEVLAFLLILSEL